MTHGFRAFVRLSPLFLTVVLTGCLFAAAAGAGAGGAIVLSGHTAEAIVDRTVEEMADVAVEVMEADDIVISDTRSADRGAKRTYEGERGELDVTVTVERTDDGTKLGVVARRGPARWDDDYARALLARIIG